MVLNNLNHNLKNSFRFGIFNWTWINGRLWEQIPFMIHLWYMEIMDCLHFFNWNGLIARLPFSQGNIPCDLYPFNIRKFALKKRCQQEPYPFQSLLLPILLPHTPSSLSTSFCVAYPHICIHFPSSLLSIPFKKIHVTTHTHLPSFANTKNEKKPYLECVKKLLLKEK